MQPTTGTRATRSVDQAFLGAARAPRAVGCENTNVCGAGKFLCVAEDSTGAIQKTPLAGLSLWL
jgi:hypothetical protein